jgi:hypothetical protein
VSGQKSDLLVVAAVSVVATVVAAVEDVTLDEEEWALL